MRRDVSIRAAPEILSEIGDRARSLAERLRRDRSRAGQPHISRSPAPWQSAASILTTLRFGHAAPGDRVAVDPTMTPMCLALEHLAGTLDLDDPGRPPPLPEITIWQPRPVDTNPLVPLLAATAARVLTGGSIEGPHPRRLAVVTDTHLRAGRLWEALTAMPSRGLGEVGLVVDLGRRRSAGVTPDAMSIRLRRLFADAGWHVIEARHGRLRREVFGRPGGDALRHQLESLDADTFRRLSTAPSDQIRGHLREGADPVVVELMDELDDHGLEQLLLDLGGHDPSVLLDCFGACDAAHDRPSVVFAHTVPWSAPTVTGTASDRLDPASPAGRLVASIGPAAPRERPPIVVPTVPAAVGTVVRSGRSGTAQVLGPLVRQLEGHEPGRRLVTCYSSRSGRAAALTSRARPANDRHVDPGNSASVLLALLGELGLGDGRLGELPFPLGIASDLSTADLTIVDEYVALGSRFVLVDLGKDPTSPPGRGAQGPPRPALPGGLQAYEPAFATELDWILCHALDRIVRADGGPTVVRVGPSRIGQEPFAAVFDRLGGSRLRRQVLAGGYRLVEPSLTAAPSVTIIGSGAVLHHAVTAADELEREGVAATVVNLTGPHAAAGERRAMQAAAVTSGRSRTPGSHLERLLRDPARKPVKSPGDDPVGVAPIVTVHESVAALEWIGGALGVFQVALGADLNETTRPGTGISPDHIVNAALLAVDAAR